MFQHKVYLNLPVTLLLSVEWIMLVFYVSVFNLKTERGIWPDFDIKRLII